MEIQEILGRIGFDWQVALANLVNFLIIFLLLKYFAFKPIAKIIKKRKDKIQKGLDDAQQAETNLMMAEEQAAEISDKARADANEIIAAAQGRVDTLMLKAEEVAHGRANAILNEAHKTAEKERSKMEREVRGQAAGLVVESVKKILQENMTEKEHEKITVRALDMMRK
jgi:F-type H+-transporting ATPase subunit b